MLRVVNTTQSGASYISPFHGAGPAAGATVQIPVDVSAFTTAEVDINGFLKPGVPIRKIPGANGTLITAAAQYVFGVTIAPSKIATTNTAGVLTAAGVIQVAVATRGQVLRALMEEILGRALSANELAAFVTAGCNLVLISA